MAVESVSRTFSGWEGDTTLNANDMKPSIGEADYKADFDSVNPYRPHAEGAILQTAISSYYDLQKTPLREKENSKNKDWDTVRDTIYDSLRPTDIKLDGEDALKAYIERKYPEVSTFLNRLEALAD